jgi:hypothetical protein
MKTKVVNKKYMPVPPYHPLDELKSTQKYPVIK